MQIHIIFIPKKMTETEKDKEECDNNLGAVRNKCEKICRSNNGVYSC